MDALSAIWGALGIIFMQLEAGIDKAHLWQIRRYSADPNVLPPKPETTEGWIHHRQLAQKAIALSKNATFMESRSIRKSENHCRHFENGTGVGFDNTHIILPVDKPLTMLSGEMAFSPMFYLGLNGGYTTVHYDEDARILQFYYRGHQQFRSYTDVEHQTDNTKSSGIWLSRMVIDDDYYAVSPNMDGRSDQLMSRNKPLLGALSASLGLVSGIQEDTSVFARPMSDTCNSTYVESGNWEEKWEAIRLPGSGESDFRALLLGADLIDVSNRAAPCGGTYLRNDYGNDTHYYGYNEFGVWNHMLLELTQGHTRDMSTADWWDEWECFYAGKDLSLCRP